MERDQDWLDAEFEVYLEKKRPKKGTLAVLIREHCYLLFFGRLSDSAEKQETAKMAVHAFPGDHVGVVGSFVVD